MDERAPVKADSVQECAEACAQDVGASSSSTIGPTVRAESTDSGECIEGFEAAPGIGMYELVLAEKDVGCSSGARHAAPRRTCGQRGIQT